MTAPTPPTPTASATPAIEQAWNLAPPAREVETSVAAAEGLREAVSSQSDTVGGFLDAVGGGGWGPIVSGTLVASGGSARHMIGSSVAAEFFVTTAIAITFAGHLGWREFGGAALALVVGGLPAAPFAAIALRYAPRRGLMVAVGGLIVGLGLYGLWRGFGAN